jgi:hypothetical protein
LLRTAKLHAKINLENQGQLLTRACFGEAVSKLTVKVGEGEEGEEEEC